MGLLNKKSLHDLVTHDAPVGQMSEIAPHIWDKGKDSTIQQDSLLEKYKYQYGESIEFTGPVPGGDSSSPFNDLNGLDGPPFQRPGDLASKAHTDSLLRDYRSHSEDLDLDGKEGRKFDKGKDSPLHDKTSLVNRYLYSHGGTLGIAGPVPKDSEYQDLNGEDGGNGYFHGVNTPSAYQGKQHRGEDLHVSLLENTYTYKHGNSSAIILQGNRNVPTHNISSTDVNPGGFYDFDGKTPSKYVDNAPELGSHF
tara:strand:+ start:995 stop:1750 length:756 start_codon:yes stop_codon:yes gene_type:complete